MQAQDDSHHTKKLELLDAKLDLVLTEVRLLKSEVSLLRTKVDVCTDKMSTHVDFVESVYDNVQHPMNFLKNRVEAWMKFSGETSPGIAAPPPEFD
jgi:hypothetical protein